MREIDASEITDTVARLCIDACHELPAIGGISATLYFCIKSATVVAYEDLKTEAV